MDDCEFVRKEIPHGDGAALPHKSDVAAHEAIHEDVRLLLKAQEDICTGIVALREGQVFMCTMLEGLMEVGRRRSVARPSSVPLPQRAAVFDDDLFGLEAWDVTPSSATSRESQSPRAHYSGTLRSSAVSPPANRASTTRTSSALNRRMSHSTSSFFRTSQERLSSKGRHLLQWHRPHSQLSLQSRVSHTSRCSEVSRMSDSAPAERSESIRRVRYATRLEEVSAEREPAGHIDVPQMDQDDVAPQLPSPSHFSSCKKDQDFSSRDGIHQQVPHLVGDNPVPQPDELRGDEESLRDKYPQQVPRPDADVPCAPPSDGSEDKNLVDADKFDFFKQRMHLTGSTGIGSHFGSVAYQRPSTFDMLSMVDEDGTFFLPHDWPACLQPKRVDGLSWDAEEQVRDRHSDPVARAIQFVRSTHGAPPRTSTSTRGISLINEGGAARFVLHPTSTPRMILDITSVLILSYDLLMTPVALAWNVSNRWIDFCHWSSLLFWTIEIIFNFRTGVFEHGELEMRPSIIARHYMETFFFIDLLTVIGDWASMAVYLSVYFFADVSGLFDILRFTKASRFLKLVGILRMSRMSEHLDRLNDHFFSELLSDLINIIFLLVIILWLNHTIACLWFGLGRLGEWSDTNLTWLNSRIDPITNATYNEASGTFQYATALHWAMTQMTPGSMPVQPLSMHERLFNVACLVFGMLVFSSFVSTLSARMTHIRMHRHARAAQMRVLSKYLRQRRVPRSLSITVKKQLEDRIWQKKPLTFEQITPLSLLTEKLRQELKVELSSRHILSHEFFRLVDKIESYSVAEVCHKAKETVLLHGDILFAAGVGTTKFHCVAKGLLHYTVAAALRKSSHSWGFMDPSVLDVPETHWICWPSMWTEWITVGTAEAAATSELLTLDGGEILVVLSRHPVLRRLTENYARIYYTRLLESVPPFAPLPNDVHQSCSDFSDIVCSINREQRVLIGLLALRALKNSNSYALGMVNVSQTAFHELEAEVESGRGILCENGKGKIERIVAVVALRISRSEVDEEICVRLATFDGEEMEVNCELPGGKRHENELPTQAVKRIMAEKLSPICGGVQLQHAEHKIEYKLSEQYNVNTKYMITTFQAHMLESFSWPDLPKPVCGDVVTKTFSLVAPPQLPLVDECFYLPNGNKKSLFAWVSPGMFDYLTTVNGKKALEAWCLTVKFELESPSSAAA